ncbi:MAG: hypothetical protein V7K69_09875 [Nostoc sp.]|uniref:hypothetical protein n=1 Tax=Nostoc sp. TaxID=1180 RepID=UPI002FFC8F6A
MRFSSYEDNQEGQVACGKAAYGFLTLTGDASGTPRANGSNSRGETPFSTRRSAKALASPFGRRPNYLTTLLLARQSTPTSQVIYFTHLMPTVERITKASRIIVRQEGVGLSMLRNVKNQCIKNKYERKNKY